MNVTFESTIVTKQYSFTPQHYFPTAIYKNPFFDVFLYKVAVKFLSQQNYETWFPIDFTTNHTSMTFMKLAIV